jgi:site-specific recombinase XerD
MTGPLAAHQDGLWADLLARGYAHFSAKHLVGVAAHLSRWLDAKRLSPADLTLSRIDAFLRHRRARGYRCWLAAKGLRPILAYLRALDVVPTAEPPPRDDSPRARLLREYETHLLDERGIQPVTTASYLRLAGLFLDDLGFSDISELRRLSAKAVSAFVVREARSSSVGYAKLKVTALRSLLRYLHVRGLCRDLVAAVPAVHGHRLSGLPKALTEEEVRRLLESCERSTAASRRDLAILLLLSRLGLRAGEVAALEIDDVRWTRGEISVRGKGSEGLLPLPHDVGDALADYLQKGRPASTSRRLFLQSCAPYRDLTRSTVGGVVSRACRRAGVPSTGSHHLRHTAATRMLRKGASLSEVAHVLRHRSLETTAIYAKVDRRALRALARRWPGGAS